MNDSNIKELKLQNLQPKIVGVFCTGPPNPSFYKATCNGPRGNSKCSRLHHPRILNLGNSNLSYWTPCMPTLCSRWRYYLSFKAVSKPNLYSGHSVYLPRLFNLVFQLSGVVFSLFYIESFFFFGLSHVFLPFLVYPLVQSVSCVWLFTIP